MFDSEFISRITRHVTGPGEAFEKGRVIVGRSCFLCWLRATFSMHSRYNSRCMGGRWTKVVLSAWNSRISSSRDLNNLTKGFHQFRVHKISAKSIQTKSTCRRWLNSWKRMQYNSSCVKSKSGRKMMGEKNPMTQGVLTNFVRITFFTG